MNEPLVLLPGIGSDAFVWQGMPEGLVMTSEAEDIEAMARDILDRAPARFALTGHSMGGYVALSILALAPERVTRLALLSTSAAPDDDAQRAARVKTIAEAGRDFDGVVETLSRAMLHKSRWNTPLREAMAAMMRRVGKEAFLRQQGAVMRRPDRRALLAAIRIPTLVLTGASDRIVNPERSRELAAAIPGARLAELPECGHIPQQESPDATAGALRSWSG